MPSYHEQLAIEARKWDEVKAKDDTEKQYFLYSSHFEGPKQEPSYTISSESNANLDNFIGFLFEKKLSFPYEPNEVASFLRPSHTWAAWTTQCVSGAVISVEYGSKEHCSIDPFYFQIPSWWSFIFSSTSDVLEHTFGLDPESLGIGSPQSGVSKDGRQLYLGLDKDNVLVDVETEVGTILSTVGLQDLMPHLVSMLGSWKATLRIKDIRGQRNLVWFYPGTQYLTKMRLQFLLSAPTGTEVKGPWHVVTELLPGLEFTETVMIAKKSVALCLTAKGAQPVPSGEVDFAIKASITHSGKTALLLAGLQIYASGMSLTIQVQPNRKDTDDDAFAVIMGWLIENLGEDDLSYVEQLFQGDIFEHVHLRRLTLHIDTSEDKPMLESAGVDMEISTGPAWTGGPGAKKVVFLVSYNWSSTLGSLGSLQGKLWNGFGTLETRILSPTYEEFYDLQPMTTDPARYIDLAALIPGEEIENIPKNLPTRLTRASIFLDSSTVSISATLTSAEADSPAAPGQSHASSEIDFSSVALQASFGWQGEKKVELSLDVAGRLIPGSSSGSTEAAEFLGTLKYNSTDKSWGWDASVDNLSVPNLWGLFDPDSAQHVSSVAKSIMISQAKLQFDHSASGGSDVKLIGTILLGSLELKANFSKDQHGLTFSASLGDDKFETTIKNVLSHMMSLEDLGPFEPWLETPIHGKDCRIDLELKKGKGEDGMFQLVTTIAVEHWELTFAQIRSTKWSGTGSVKRVIRVSVANLTAAEAKIPLIGDLPPLFDEVCFFWVQDKANKGGSTSASGLTRREMNGLNACLAKNPLAIGEEAGRKKDDDVAIASGCHFVIMGTGVGTNHRSILDLSFGRGAKSGKASEEGAATNAGGADEADADDTKTAVAPFKKKAGPLSISSLGLKYANKKFHLTFTANFNLGPLAFSLLGFGLGVQVKGFHDIKLSSITLEGLSAALEITPLTIAGVIRHSKTKTLDSYAGGLVIGFVPYQLEAAGFYGETTSGTKSPDDTFTSMFVFLRLDGPLVTLAFAEISGVTGGFGYNFDIRTPAPEQVVDFPFVKPSGGSQSADDIVSTLDSLVSTGPDGWFSRKQDSYWAAVGMKVDAFEMISLDAVAVVQFGQSPKIGIFAVALVDVPTSASSLKLAHVEMGISVVIDLGYGTFKAEAQLSPKSYILDPNCHLTGGFAIYSWFDAPHANRSRIGDFVFTLGGYHRLFQPSPDYPKVPRLGISWSLGSSLSISGEAYFAMTPKAAMAGGRLRASYHGIVEAWFDAHADFLINYKPFSFNASIGVCIGVGYSIDVLFIHSHHSIDISADLSMWGPPVAGYVHIDFLVFHFNIAFGGHEKKDTVASLPEFYRMVIQADRRSKAKGTQANPSHNFLAQSGLMNTDDNHQQGAGKVWTVRGGTLSLLIECKMAFSSATFGGKKVPERGGQQYEFYAKPMQLTECLTSDVNIEIAMGVDRSSEGAWEMSQVVKSVPRALWDKYDAGSDPLASGNSISSLLTSSDSSMGLLMGVELRAPRATVSTEEFRVFDAVPEVIGGDVYNERGASAERSGTYAPDGKSMDGEELYGRVQKSFVSLWEEAFRWESEMLPSMKAPARLMKMLEHYQVGKPMVLGGQ